MPNISLVFLPISVWHFSLWVWKLSETFNGYMVWPCACVVSLSKLQYLMIAVAGWGFLWRSCLWTFRLVLLVRFSSQTPNGYSLSVQCSIQFEGYLGAWVVSVCTWYECCIIQSHGMVRCVCITERSGKSCQRIFTFDAYQQSFKM